MFNYISSFMYLMGILSFCMMRKHLLLMLLTLEFIVLSLYFLLIVVLSYFSYEFYFSMIFLIMGLCAGSLGLSILISLIRSHMMIILMGIMLYDKICFYNDFYDPFMF